MPTRKKERPRPRYRAAGVSSANPEGGPKCAEQHRLPRHRKATVCRWAIARMYHPTPMPPSVRRHRCFFAAVNEGERRKYNGHGKPQQPTATLDEVFDLPAGNESTDAIRSPIQRIIGTGTALPLPTASCRNSGPGTAPLTSLVGNSRNGQAILAGVPPRQEGRSGQPRRPTRAVPAITLSMEASSKTSRELPIGLSSSCPW